VLFNPSKNIHVKFKTTLASHKPSVERPSTSNNNNNNNNNNAEELAAANRRRRHTSTDFPTEVSLYASKSD
ncbi:unnamed protein product, partial [Rotaria magnacalcarata]